MLSALTWCQEPRGEDVPGHPKLFRQIASLCKHSPPRRLPFHPDTLRVSVLKIIPFCLSPLSNSPGDVLPVPAAVVVVYRRRDVFDGWVFMACWAFEISRVLKDEMEGNTVREEAVGLSTGDGGGGDVSGCLHPPGTSHLAARTSYYWLV